MNISRPKNLNLFTIRFPSPAIASILHRISGLILFLLIPVMIWLLSLSFTTSGFEMLQNWLSYGLVRFIFWLFFIPFCYHLVAGIRHLLMDIHLGSTLPAGKHTAIAAIIIAIILSLLLGVWLW